MSHWPSDNWRITLVAINGTNCLTMSDQFLKEGRKAMQLDADFKVSTIGKGFTSIHL